MSISIWKLVKRTFSVWISHDAGRLAASVSFYAMMAIAPLIVVALNVASLIYGRAAEAHIYNFVGTEGAPATAIWQILDATAHSKHGAPAVVIGSLIALFSGSSLFSCLQSSINILWDIKPRQNAKTAVRNRIISGLMVFVAGLVLLTSVALSAALGFVADRLGASVLRISYIGDTLVSLVTVTLLFAAIYKYLPPAKILWSDVWLGALLTAAMFVIGKFGLAIYFQYLSFKGAYGAAGSLAAFLIWVYYSVWLIFLGAAFTHVYADMRGQPIEPDPYAEKVRSDDYWTSLMSRAMPQEHPATNGQTRRRVPWWGLLGAALAGGIGAWMISGEERRIRAKAAVLKLPERLDAVNTKLKAAQELRGTLKQLSVADRMDRVEKRLRET